MGAQSLAARTRAVIPMWMTVTSVIAVPSCREGGAGVFTLLA
jgi:hypothetical protein